MKLKEHLLIGGSLLLLPLGLNAQSFTYNNRDLMAVFHKTGSPDLEVDIGSISIYKTLGLTYHIDSFNTTQLTTAFGNLNGLSWSVMGAVRSGQGDASASQNTLWLTRSRLDINTTASPYDRKSNSSQSTVSATINGIAGNGSVNGAVPWSAGMSLNPVSNTKTAIIIPSSDPNSYSQLAGLNGSLNGTFGQGGFENTTAADFSTGFSRSDLYELIPGSGEATLLGTFEFRPDGSLTFQSVPEPGEIALIAMGGALLVAARKRKSSGSSNSI